MPNTRALPIFSQSVINIYRRGNDAYERYRVFIWFLYFFLITFFVLQTVFCFFGRRMFIYFFLKTYKVVHSVTRTCLPRLTYKFRRTVVRVTRIVPPPHVWVRSRNVAVHRFSEKLKNFGFFSYPRTLVRAPENRSFLSIMVYSSKCRRHVEHYARTGNGFIFFAFIKHSSVPNVRN